MYSMKTSSPPLSVNYSKEATKKKKNSRVFVRMILSIVVNQTQCHTHVASMEVYACHKLMLTVFNIIQCFQSEDEETLVN